ncbi:hypothetical protein RJ55_08699 [Drechmeria coniospora]|nr:hypothetical protein RJ55_08699 [Drechmeria coniospora]
MTRPQPGQSRKTSVHSNDHTLSTSRTECKHTLGYYCYFSGTLCINWGDHKVTLTLTTPFPATRNSFQ